MGAPEALEQIINSLGCQSTLTGVDLLHNNDNCCHFAAEMLESVAKLTVLHDLNLAGINMQDSCHDELGECISQLPLLTSLNVTNCNINSCSRKLQRGISKCTNLQKLKFFNNWVGLKILQEFFNLTRLEHLELPRLEQGNYCERELCSNVWQHISKLTRLTGLRFPAHGVSIASQVTYATTLTALRVLSVSGAASATAFTAMASIMSQLPMLEDLGYIGMRYLDPAVQSEDAFKTAFAECFSRALNLKHFWVEGGRHLPCLANAVASCLLDVRNLQVINIAHEGTTHSDPMMLCMQLANLRALETVSISRNTISTEALQALGKSLEGLSTVRALSLTHCSISREGFTILFQHFSTVTSIKHLDLSWNKFNSDMPKAVTQQLDLGLCNRVA